MRSVRFLASALTLVPVLSFASTAGADPTCMTVDDFNSYMAGQAPLTAVTLRYDVTGVNPVDFAGTKGCLVDFENETCTLGAGATLKVYGLDETNTSHPTGTLKFEYGNMCCASGVCGEGWAEPNASLVVFTDGTEQCTVTAWIDPAQYGYTLDCGGTLFEGVGDNTDGLMVDRISILRLWDGGWEMPNAVTTWNEVCFEAPVVDPGDPGDPTVPETLTVPVLEDATVLASLPDTVITPVEDLSLGLDDGVVYLKFDLTSVPGEVVGATLYLHQSDVTSAAGDGGDAFAVASSSWSEGTITYNGRPATSGSSLARQSPIDAFDWYAWDVTAAVQAPAVYSFAIVPGAADLNGAHFFSKEGSSTLAPYLSIEYTTATGGEGTGGSWPGGPDDCSATPEGCGATGTSSGGSTGGNAGSDDGLDDPSSGPTAACACSVPGGEGTRFDDQHAAELLALGLAALVARRPRRRRLASR